MPKILENIRERAIEEARRELEAEGYRAMTIRRVAAQLGIGTGTLYNYFPSKEYLAADVMLKDWQEQMRAFEGQETPGDAEEVIRRLFAAVQAFTARYQRSWNQYDGMQNRSDSMRRQYHTVLVRQLGGYIDRALPKEAEPWLAAFLAELVLRFASDGQSRYGDIEAAVNRLLQKNE